MLGYAFLTFTENPMIDFEELSKEWKEDARYDELELEEAIHRVPILHAKWLEKTTRAKLSLFRLNTKYNVLRQLKFRYYRGECTKEELDKHGWPQWQGAKPLKSAMDEFLEGDSELNTAKEKIAYMETIVYFLEQVMRSLNSRGYDLKTMLQAKQFYSGM